MAVTLRFRRVGKPKSALYQLVAADERRACSAACLEVLGHYNPKASDEQKLSADIERLRYWVNNGAKPSDSVLSLLRKSGLWSQIKTPSK